MTIVQFQISLHIEKRDEHLTRILFHSLDPQETSLNIDMNIILPVKFSCVSADLNN